MLFQIIYGIQEDCKIGASMLYIYFLSFHPKDAKEKMKTMVRHNDMLLHVACYLSLRVLLFSYISSWSNLHFMLGIMILL